MFRFSSQGTPIEENRKIGINSTIQRFEYTIESFWKFLKIYMQHKLGIIPKLDGPKGILREALNAKLITNEEFEVLVEGVADRNLTSYIYKEEIAELLVAHLPQYYETMTIIMNRM